MTEAERRLIAAAAPPEVSDRGACLSRVNRIDEALAVPPLDRALLCDAV